jgi:hypothetical protein
MTNLLSNEELVPLIDHFLGSVDSTYNKAKSLCFDLTSDSYPGCPTQRCFVRLQSMVFHYSELPSKSELGDGIEIMIEPIIVRVNAEWRAKLSHITTGDRLKDFFPAKQDLAFSPPLGLWAAEGHLTSPGETPISLKILRLLPRYSL